MSGKKVLNFTIINFFLCFTVLTFVKASTLDSPTYTVGVVEYRPTFFGEPEAIAKRNLQGYKDVLQKNITDNDGVDIIIFPESSLNTEEASVFVPNPKNNVLPCNKTNLNQDLLSELSCLAKDYKKYMVFNIKEKENCTAESQKENKDTRKCASDGLSRYNTNVVFDRNGTLISRYRKWNLYDGIMINITKTPEYMTFKTDFGVEFVSIVCFDVLWWTPTMELVKKGQTNFIHPIYWYSELPFLTANQVHQGWAYAANVNLLTSAANYASDGATGSAVFNGRQGSIVSRMSTDKSSVILFAKVPKSNSTTTKIVTDEIQPRYDAVPERLTGITLDRDITVNTYANLLINSTAINITEKVCHKSFCCEFNLVRKPFSDTENKTHYSYRLVAFSGPRNFTNSKQKKWMQSCAVIACIDDKSIESCAKIFNDQVTYWNTHYFESIEIEADFRKQEKMLIMPSSVDAMIRPLPVSGFNLTTADVGKKTKAVMKLTKPVSDLLTFGIFADYYDGFTSASSRNTSCIITLIVAIFVCITKY